MLQPLADARHPARVAPHGDAETTLASSARIGFWLALATALVTLLSFGLALTAIPDAGPHCTVNCASYPFTGANIAEQFPGDDLWMHPAMVVMVLVMALVVCVHQCAPPERRAHGLLGLCLAFVAAAVLLIDDFVQVTVMQPSLVKGQLDGWTMLTQYNPNGVFIALEELGYLLMGLALLCASRAFPRASKVERAIRWLFGLAFAAILLALLVVSGLYGVDRQDRFEVPVISVFWTSLIAGGPLLAVAFRRLEAPESSPTWRRAAWRPACLVSPTTVRRKRTRS